MKLSFRQGIVRHQTDALETPTFLDVSGGYVSLVVSPDPTIIAFVHGPKDYLYTERLSVPNAWGPFTTGSNYWLYWNLNPATGVRSFGYTTMEPVEAYAPPTSPVTGQMWFSTSTNLWYEWSGSSWVEVIRVFACKLENGATPRSMSINAPDFRGTQVGLTTPTRVGAIAYDSTGKPIRTGDGKFFTTEDAFVAGVPSGASLRINNVMLPSTAQQPMASHTVVEFSDFGEVSPASPLTQGEKLFGIIEEDADTNEVVNVITSGVVSKEDWDWIGEGAEVNDPVYINGSGQLTLTTISANWLPVGVVIGRREIMFSPKLFATFEAVVPQTFTELGDTPTDYVGAANQIIRVNATEDSLIFDTVSWGEVSGTLSDQADLYAELSDRVSKSVSTLLDTSVNITLQGGEVLGLPAVPSVGNAAASKAYVDAQIQTQTWRDPILDPEIAGINVNNPPTVPSQHESFIIGDAASGAWVPFAPGTIVQWNGSSWADVLGRPVEVGDRLGISIEPTVYPTPNLSPSLASHQGKLATVTDATVGAVVLSFDVPVDGNAVFVNNEGSSHFGHSYIFAGEYGVGTYGTEYRWIEFLSPVTIGAGANLEYSGNTLNVVQGAGSGLDADLWDGMQSAVTMPTQGQYLTYNETTSSWENTDLPVTIHPYDVPLFVAGAPSDGTFVWHAAPARSFTLGPAGHVGYAETAPSGGDAVFNVYISTSTGSPAFAKTLIGSFRFASGSNTMIIDTFVSTVVDNTSFLHVKCVSANGIADVAITLAGLLDTI